MSKKTSEPSEEQVRQRRDAALKRALNTPHLPHVDKSLAKRKKKNDGPSAKKNRRPK